MYYGPELVAQALRDWLKEIGVQTAYIEPGLPWENGFCENRSGPVPLNSIPQFISGFSTLLKSPLMRVAGF